ncbi:MAG: AraC family transcriptional regulator [Oscillospiraceae bacterium]|nr:AraC family transcriptional regulator [Oscillospiraceae bacterium]
MTATEQEKQVYGDRVEILSRDKDSAVYRITESDGDVVMSSYRVFEGIHLVYNDVHTAACNIERGKIGDILEINHCREGRIECSFKDEYLYLEPGDMSISNKHAAGHDSFFPTSHYHGITIMIDVEKAPACLSCFLDDVNVSPAALSEKFCNKRQCFVARSADYIEHIFSELYSVRDSIRKGYFKIKVLELLLFLSGMDADSTETAKHSYTPSQVLLAKRTCKFIAAHLSDRITISQLAALFHVSETQLKKLLQGCLRHVCLRIYPFAEDEISCTAVKKNGLHRP